MERQTLTFAFGWNAKVIMVGIAISAILLLMFVASAALNLILSDLPPVASLALLIFPALWGFFLFWWGPRATARTYGKLYEGPHRLELDTDVVRATTAAGLNELKWHAFHRALETREFFLLFFTGNAAYYWPIIGGPFDRTAWQLCARCCVSGPAQWRHCAMIGFSTPVRACCD